MTEYYYPEEESWKKRFEVTIPLLLLILILFVLAWKFGWLGSVPIIGELLGGKTVNVAVIGNDVDLMEIIDSDVRKVANVNYMTFTAEDLFNARGMGEDNPFAKYSLMIITEGNNGATKTLNRWNYDQINEFASSKPVIIIKQAATKVENDPYANGWKILTFVPVSCASAAGSCDVSVVNWDEASLQTPYAQSHPMLNKLNWPLEFSSQSGSIEYVDIIPTGTTLVQLERPLASDPTQKATVPVVVEGSGTLTKYIYFAFHPRHYKTLLVEAIRYLANV
ncbi:hypothetical protein DRN74_02345 [Candidatus Micrarchaeota archaeon]|nr:MAG: hypothetical protein DRN74_02345 [Candidatus Micrarchaeota archaeon]